MGGNLIDLRSDTVTKPSEGMMVKMMNAKVGDDVFGDDPTVIELEQMASRRFGMDGALFCPSGTMTNQIAVKVHTQPGEEIICEQGSHVYRYEGGGIAYNSGCSVRLVQGSRGRVQARQVEENINPDNVHFPKTSLVVVENTSNRGGGSVYKYEDLMGIAKVCRDHDLKLHLDGARLYNALIASGTCETDYGELFDSISICLSKGLGAPVGSLLLGKASFIKEARRKRKVMGGGMRQAGYLAAAGIYALENNVERLADDHENAKALAEILEKYDFVEEVIPPESNILIFKLKPGLSEHNILEKMKKEGLLAVDFGPGTIRMVTHLDFDKEGIVDVVKVLDKVGSSI
jgi:threonine aldolase